MMMSSLVESFPQIDFKAFDRRFFNEKKGLEFVQTLCYKEYTWVDIELEAKYYSLSSCGALLQYIFTEKKVFFIEFSANHYLYYYYNFVFLLLDSIHGQDHEDCL